VYFLKFEDLKLDAAVLRGVSALGFDEPTKIQAESLPQAIEARDILASAMTGSGKTAAFVLPILNRLMKQKGARGTRALVLTPTRELACQVHDHVVALGRYTQISSVTVFGGVKPAPQERALRSGVNIVVATPGRLLDHMQRPWFRIDELDVLVLDEADRMLDMGFLPDIRRILARLPAQRQTMLFSATLPGPIVKLSRDLLHDPVRINVERQARPATGVRQAVVTVPEQRKKELLLKMLEQEVGTALVFTRTKHRANRLAQYLGREGISCDRIHGNRSQAQRQAALAAFKAGRIQVLVATDVASRGIDVEALPHVINFDVPAQPDDYVHRVGRTARAGATGDAVTFVSPAEENNLRAIERTVGSRIDRKKIQGFSLQVGDAAASKTSAGDVRRKMSPNRNRPRRPTNTRERRNQTPEQRTGSRRQRSGRSQSRSEART